MAEAMKSFEFSSFLRFTLAVFRHWGALVTGGIFIGVLFIFQGTGHYVGPIIYWLVAIVAIFLAGYKAWDDERKAKEGALAALNLQSSTIGAEWKDLANRLEKVGLDVSAQWQCNRRNNQTTLENWTFSGTYSKPCETLCRFAGTLLAKSPHVSPKVSQLALQQSNPAWRWLFFLRENHDALAPGSGRPPIGDDGTIYLIGTISNVAAVSARVCIECAALEL